jgi:N-glycosylase/DNA lyase
MHDLFDSHFQINNISLDLERTLNSGQTFCWVFLPDLNLWSGWIQNKPCYLKQLPNGIEIWGSKVTREEVIYYFSLDLDAQSLAKEWKHDKYLQKAMNEARGLNIIRDPWWECISNFICSSLKQIVHIQQLNQSLRRGYGSEIKSYHTNQFPDFKIIAQSSEEELRKLKLGYRAKYLCQSAQMLSDGGFSKEEMPKNYDEALKKMKELSGIGDKVAQCILLYGGQYYEAFPVDVWVMRLVKELYFPKKKKLTSQEISAWSKEHFGPRAGIAQLYLFDWYRRSS